MPCPRVNCRRRLRRSPTRRCNGSANSGAFNGMSRTVRTGSREYAQTTRPRPLASVRAIPRSEPGRPTDAGAATRQEPNLAARSDDAPEPLGTEASRAHGSLPSDAEGYTAAQPPGAGSALVEQPALLTVSGAAQWLGISRALLYRSLQSGQVPLTPIVLGNTRYLARRQLEAWLDHLDSPIAAPKRDADVSLTYDDLDALFASGAARK